MTRLKYILLIVIIALFGANLFAQNHYKLEKIIADAIAVNHGLVELKNRQPEHPILHFLSKIEATLGDLEKAGVEAKKNEDYIKLTITQQNKAEIEKAVVQLSQLQSQLQMTSKRMDITFKPESYPIKRMLNSENPGNYYQMVWSDSGRFVYNHPLRNEQEEVHLNVDDLQTYVTKKDTSFIHLVDYFPNLKTLILSDVGLTDTLLSDFNIAAGFQLEVFDLSSNKLHELSANFNALNRLKYLDLSGNKLTTLPEGFDNWNQLVYLNLSENQLTDSKKKEIREGLPHTLILF